MRDQTHTFKFVICPQVKHLWFCRLSRENPCPSERTVAIANACFSRDSVNRQVSQGILTGAELSRCRNRDITTCSRGTEFQLEWNATISHHVICFKIILCSSLRSSTADRYANENVRLGATGSHRTLLSNSGNTFFFTASSRKLPGPVT